MGNEGTRRKVNILKSLYKNILWFVLGNALFAFIWFIFDRSGTFWPKYVFLVWGISLIIETFHRNNFLFFTSQWEERKVEKVMKQHANQHRIQLNRHRKKEV